MRSDVAIIIVTYNSEDHIQECLDSVLNQRESVIQQVIVVDNQSTDRTRTIIKQYYPLVKLIESATNEGFARGVNIGAEHADADYVLLLNPDTVILHHAIDTIIQFARDNPNYGIFGGRTLTPTGSLEPSSCWGIPTLLSIALFAFGISKVFPKNRWLDPESLGSWPRDTIREVGVITGCYCLTSIEIWQQLKGLDERYFMYGEDVDFAIRAADSGHRSVICPDSTLIHRIGKSSKDETQRKLLLFKGKATLVKQHWKGSKRTIGIILLSIGTALRALSEFVASITLNPMRKKTWQTLWNTRTEWLQGY